MTVHSIKALLEGPWFDRREPIAGAGDVIRWWESRRLFFNMVVGCTGIITCVLLIICAFTADSTVGEPIGLPDGPLLGVFGILLYGILANICYTGGWVCELLVRTARKAKSSTSFGLTAFRMGITFSIFITLCPAVICWLIFAIALLTGQKHGQ
jgi:hypothetical protein